MSEGSVEEVLLAELAKGDVVLATTRPILHHLLANADLSLFGDEVIARIRGMMSHVARQMLMVQAECGGIEDRGAFADEAQEDLARMLFDDTVFLALAHSLVMEAQLADQLRSRSGIDCVLSPLLQELAASTDPHQAGAAVHVLASQARFMQTQRRMELPLRELPGELLHKALMKLRDYAPDDDAAKLAEQRLRAGFDEGAGRLGQIARLVMQMGRKAPRALAIDHAGVAIFATALAMASGQEREIAVLSLGDNQLARLALALRASGLKQAAVEEQFLYLHPDVSLPAGFDTIPAERAAAMLSASQLEPLA